MKQTLWMAQPRFLLFFFNTFQISWENVENNISRFKNGRMFFLVSSTLIKRKYTWSYLSLSFQLCLQRSTYTHIINYDIRFYQISFSNHKSIIYRMDWPVSFYISNPNFDKMRKMNTCVHWKETLLFLHPRVLVRVLVYAPSVDMRKPTRGLDQGRYMYNLEGPLFF